MQAFDLTNYVFRLVGNIDMDDSDGGTTSVANVCYKMWQGVLKHCSEEEKKKLFLWFQEHSTGGYVIDFMEDYLQDFLMNEFHDKELLLKKLEVIDFEIAKQEMSTDCGSTWSAHYGYQNNILKRLELMGNWSIRKRRSNSIVRRIGIFLRSGHLKFKSYWKKIM